MTARGWGAGTAAIVGTLWLASLAGSLVLAALNLDEVRRLGLGNVGSGTLSLFAVAGVMVAYASLGALVIRRRPGHRVGWLLLLTAPAVLAVFVGFGAGARLAAERGIHDPVAGAVAWLAVVLFAPAILMEISLLPILFPDGRLPGPRWRRPVGLVLAATAAGSLAFAIAPGQFDPQLAANPLGLPGASDALLFVGTVLDTVAIVVGGGLGIVSIAVRFRRSRDDARAQMKWMLAAVTVVVCLILPGELGLDPDGLLAIPSAAAIGLIPLAVTVAILRYRLYEIDRLISRTLAYAIVTAVLGALFAGLVIGLQTLALPVIGGSQLAVALSTLTVVALFGPVRRRVQGFVDRRFNRARYDAARVAEGFGARLRDRLDLDDVSAELATTTLSALRPESVSVWVRRQRS